MYQSKEQKLTKYLSTLKEAVDTYHMSNYYSLEYDQKFIKSIEFAIGSAIQSEDIQLINNMFSYSDITGFDPKYVVNIAAYHGKLEVVKHFISRVCRTFWSEFISLASAGGQLEVIKFLVSCGARVQSVGWSALTTAASNGRLEVVKWLVDNGCSVTLCDNDAVNEAVRMGQLETVKFLMSVGASVSEDSIRDAFVKGHLQVFSYLFEQSRDNGLKFGRGDYGDKHYWKNGKYIELNEWLVDDWSIKQVMFSGDLSTFKYLIENGCSPDIFDGLAMEIAISKKDLSAMRFLISSGANYHRKCFDFLNLDQTPDSKEGMLSIIDMLSVESE